jgi:hypothetical protein
MKTIVVSALLLTSLVTASQARESAQDEPATAAPEEKKEEPGWTKDLHVRTDFTYKGGTWTFVYTIRNASSTAAYRTLKYEIAWFGSESVDSKTLEQVIEPGKQIEIKEERDGPSAFGKVDNAGGTGMILASESEGTIVGIAIDESQIDKSVRTTFKIVGANLGSRLP